MKKEAAAEASNEKFIEILHTGTTLEAQPNRNKDSKMEAIINPQIPFRFVQKTKILPTDRKTQLIEFHLLGFSIRWKFIILFFGCGSSALGSAFQHKIRRCHSEGNLVSTIDSARNEHRLARLRPNSPGSLVPYPNPANGGAAIQFQLPTQSGVLVYIVPATFMNAEGHIIQLGSAIINVPGGLVYLHR
ncbi:MAG: hypothetical protein ACREOO_21465 [bacterium]